MNDNHNTLYEYYSYFHKKLIDVVNTMSMEELKILFEKAKEIKGEDGNERRTNYN